LGGDSIAPFEKILVSKHPSINYFVSVSLNGRKVKDVTMESRSVHWSEIANLLQPCEIDRRDEYKEFTFAIELTALERSSSPLV
jgi:hypothetical protein